MIVNIKDFYPNANYIQYLNNGNEISKPKNSTLSVGMLMYDTPNNSIGMILGCIDEYVSSELRLDSDGMQPIDNLRLAKKSDFEIKDVRFVNGLDKYKVIPKINYIVETLKIAQITEDSLLHEVECALRGRQSFIDVELNQDEKIYTADVFEAILSEDNEYPKLSEKALNQLADLSVQTEYYNYIQII